MAERRVDGIDDPCWPFCACSHEDRRDKRQGEVEEYNQVENRQPMPGEPKQPAIECDRGAPSRAARGSIAPLSIQRSLQCHPQMNLVNGSFQGIRSDFHDRNARMIAPDEFLIRLDIHLAQAMRDLRLQASEHSADLITESATLTSV